MKKLMWPGVLFVLIGSSVVLHAVMIVVAVNDPSFAVDESYGNARAAWDDSVRQARLNEQLGWTVTLELTDAAADLPAVPVRIDALDRLDRPVLDARVHLAAFHHARAADVHRVTLTAVGGGRYVGALPMRRAGAWECTAVIERGDARFVATFDRDVPDRAGEDGP